ncbi:MAG TPA: hypothetical protein VLV76_24395 [Candidatus Acidoferrum sp.]|nr:hypothetical protein [Candidatus Acidoferrum sp.]
MIAITANPSVIDAVVTTITRRLPGCVAGVTAITLQLCRRLD